MKKSIDQPRKLFSITIDDVVVAHHAIGLGRNGSNPLAKIAAIAFPLHPVAVIEVWNEATEAVRAKHKGYFIAVIQIDVMSDGSTEAHFAEIRDDSAADKLVPSQN